MTLSEFQKLVEEKTGNGKLYRIGEDYQNGGTNCSCSVCGGDTYISGDGKYTWCRCDLTPEDYEKLNI